MDKNILKIINEYLRSTPKSKKIVGITLVILGFIALVTPFTPGSWLSLIGLELLGLRTLFFKKKDLEK